MHPHLRKAACDMPHDPLWGPPTHGMKPRRGKSRAECVPSGGCQGRLGRHRRGARPSVHCPGLTSASARRSGGFGWGPTGARRIRDEAVRLTGQGVRPGARSALWPAEST